VCACHALSGRLTPEHPDPLGEQLIALATAIEKAEENDGNRQCFPSEAGIFIDYASLCQKDADGKRSVEDNEAFGRALSRMQVRAHTKLRTVAQALLSFSYMLSSLLDSRRDTVAI